MNVSDRGFSTEWAPVPSAGDAVAEARLNPDADPPTLEFRVPRSQFDVDDLTQLVTVEDLLTAAGVPATAAGSWAFLDESHDGQDGTNLELKRLLPPPPPAAAHLTVRVRLKPAAGPAADVSPETWQALDALWKAILGLEAHIDSLRLGLDGLRGELDAAYQKGLTVEEKVHALQADVSRWNKAKSLARYTVPKAREFVHRATWASATPERKRLEEIIETHVRPRVPLPDLDDMRVQLEHLQKDRQVLLQQGNAVSQECRGILGEIQRALASLQRNAADRDRQKRSAGRDKGKHL